jgi:hypothetical protein
MDIDHVATDDKRTTSNPDMADAPLVLLALSHRKEFCFAGTELRTWYFGFGLG